MKLKLVQFLMTPLGMITAIYLANLIFGIFVMLLFGNFGYIVYQLLWIGGMIYLPYRTYRNDKGK